MDEPLKIQLYNREMYENGDRRGAAWLKLPATIGQLNAVLASIGAAGGEQGKDFFIAYSETPVHGLTRELVESASLDELNYLAARLATLDEHEAAKLNALNHTVYAMDSTRQFIDYADNHDFFVFLPGVTNAAELGDYYLHHSEMIEMPEEWKGAVNVLTLGQLAKESEAGKFTEYGYIVESGDHWHGTYNGREDIPQEYRIAPTDRQEREYDAISTRAPAVAVSTPAAPIVLASDNPKDRLKEITGRLEAGIKGIFESDQYAAYLKTLSKFHNYSFNNCLLIAMQKPDATHVAGYGSWRDNFGRNVRKGEKGIKIIAPSPFIVKEERERIDPDSGRPVTGTDGKPVNDEVEVKIPAFKVATVFDVSQTEGEPLPEIGVDELSGDVDRYNDFLRALEKSSPVPIDMEDIGSGAKGYYEQVEKRIVIQEGMGELQTLKTAIHETAHARLHDIDRNAPQGAPRPDRYTREVEAESVAYTVCQHYGLDTSDYSFGYIAGWSGDKELDTLKASLDTIRREADAIINEVDVHFSELQNAQGTRRQTSVFETLSPRQQQSLSDEVKATLQFLVDNDLKDQGGITGGTLEAIAAQGYEYRDGQLEKLSEQPTAGQPHGTGGQSEPAAAEETAAKYYPINETTARRAKEMNSFSDYRQGSETAAYKQSVDEAAMIAKRQKERVDPMYHEKIDRLLDTYARKLAENMNSRNAIDARVPSVMISGPANFPVRKKEKQNAARDRNMEEWRNIQGLLDKIKSTGMGGISADDPDAIKKLEAKLAGLEQSQETMKKVNAYYRSHKTLDGCPHVPQDTIDKIKESMSGSWRGEHAKPFEAYSLQNNGAEIRRVKERIKELTRRAETPFVGWQFDGGKVHANAKDNRLQIFFDGKPDDSTRAELKQAGFRWSPKAEAWQRQLTYNAIYSANNIRSIQPATGERPTDLQKRARTEAAQSLPQEQTNPLKTAEMSTEQNLNMIDGTLNNTPTVAELEARAKRGEPVSLTDLAGAIKAERGAQQTERMSADAPKPSIREQLRRGREQIARERQEPQKAVDSHHHDRGDRL
jgi:antirestriction protein ArdC